METETKRKTIAAITAFAGLLFFIALIAFFFGVLVR